MIELAFELYSEIAEYAIPIAVVFELCNIVVGTFLRAAFGGRLWFGAR